MNQTLGQVGADFEKGIEEANTLIQAIHQEIGTGIEKMVAGISKYNAGIEKRGTQLNNALADPGSGVRILFWEVSILLAGATLVRIIFSYYSSIQY